VIPTIGQGFCLQLHGEAGVGTVVGDGGGGGGGEGWCGGGYNDGADSYR